MAVLAFLGGGTAAGQPDEPARPHPPRTEGADHANNDAEGHYRSGRALYLEGRYDEAVVELEQALALDPNAPILLYNIALVYEKLARFERAVEYLRRYQETEEGGQEHERVDAAIRRIQGAARHRSEHPVAPPRVVHVPMPVPTPVGPERSLGRADGWFWTAMGFSGVALAAAAIAGGLAVSTDADVQRFVLGETGTRADRQGLIDRTNNLALAADISLGTCLVSAAVGMLLYALRWTEGPAGERVGRGPGSPAGANL